LTLASNSTWFGTLSLEAQKQPGMLDI